jgi:hypothetical protein
MKWDVSRVSEEKLRMILSKEFITVTDIMRLFKLGKARAGKIFDRVAAATEKDGKIVIDNRILARRMYKMLGLPFPLDKGQWGGNL